MDYECDYGMLFYILSEIVPITTIFLVIIILNIQLTSGALNGFLFFVQFINIMQIEGNGYVATNALIERFSIAYRFIYNIFNLTFFALTSCPFVYGKVQQH